MMLTVGLASALGGLAGVLLGMTLGSISPYMGTNFGLKGLTVLIVAGTGHITGAMIFGLVLGLIEIFSVAIFSSAYRDLIAVIILIVILIFRPQGLFGKAART
jgi:branched-chain amino acid transport system permease protein